MSPTLALSFFIAICFVFSSLSTCSASNTTVSDSDPTTTSYMYAEDGDLEDKSNAYTCNDCQFCDNVAYGYGNQFDFSCTYGKRLRFKIYSDDCPTNLYLGCCNLGSRCSYDVIRTSRYLTSCTDSSTACTGDYYCATGKYLFGVIDSCSVAGSEYTFVFQGMGELASDTVFINIDDDTNVLSYKTYDPNFVGASSSTTKSGVNLAFADSVFCEADNIGMQLGKATGLDQLCTSELKSFCHVAGWPAQVVARAVKAAFNLFSKSCVASTAQDAAVGHIVSKLSTKYNVLSEMCSVVCGSGSASTAGTAFSSSTLMLTAFAGVFALLAIRL